MAINGLTIKLPDRTSPQCPSSTGIDLLLAHDSEAPVSQDHIWGTGPSSDRRLVVPVASAACGRSA